MSEFCNIFRNFTTYYSFAARTNAIYGYTFLAVAPQKENFTNGLVFVAHWDPKFPNNPDPTVWVYKSTGLESTTNTSTILQGLVFQNFTGINQTDRLVQRWNWRTISSTRPQLLRNEFTVGIILNIDMIWGFFSAVPNNQTDWYVYMAVNHLEQPTSTDPTKFPKLWDGVSMRIRDWGRYNYCFVPGIYRWSLLTLPTYIIELAFYALLIPLCLVLSWKWQPMKSRGFTPALAAFSQLTVLFAQIHYMAADVQTISNYDCLMNIFLYYSATQIALILLPIHLARYIFIINMNNAKDIYYSEFRVTKDGEHKKVEVARWQFRFIKILTNPWLNFAIVILWYIFTASVQTIVFLASGLSCGLTTYPIAVLQVVVIVCFIICWLLGLCYDFVASCVEGVKSIKKKKEKNPELNVFVEGITFLWNQFAKKDPFYYRFELYFIGPIIIVFYLVTSLVILIARVDTIRGVSIALSSTLFHLLLFYQVLFPLGLTLFEILRQSCTKTKQINEEIDQVLLDADGHQIFVEFAQSEWSTENISCYDDIQKYRKEKDGQKRHVLAEELFLTYFNGPKSQLEVNVSKNICDDIKNALTEVKDGTATTTPEALFNGAEGSIKVNLCDTYSRLRLTQLFKRYQSKKAFTKETLGK